LSEAFRSAEFFKFVKRFNVFGFRFHIYSTYFAKTYVYGELLQESDDLGDEVENRDDLDNLKPKP
jgi:hypothetical protein